MKSITVAELKAKQDKNEDFQLIDIREGYELDICQIGGEHLPMGEILENLDKISTEKEVIVHCRSGKRSAAVINALETQYGFTNLINLEGGILAYAEQIDPTLSLY